MSAQDLYLSPKSQALGSRQVFTLLLVKGNVIRRSKTLDFCISVINLFPGMIILLI